MVVSDNQLNPPGLQNAQVNRVVWRAFRRLIVIAVLSMICDSTSTRASDESEVVTPATVVDEGDSPSLDRTEFSLRRRSTIELWRDRDQYRDAVIQGLRSSDLETNERARWVIDRWRRGIFADTPSAIAERLAAMAPVEAIEWLLELGDFTSATLALEEAVGTLEYDGIASRIGMTLNIRFPVYARKAIEQNSELDLLSFLDQAITSKELAVCRRDWSRLIGQSERGAMGGPRHSRSP